MGLVATRWPLLKGESEKRNMFSPKKCPFLFDWFKLKMNPFTNELITWCSTDEHRQSSCMMKTNTEVQSLYLSKISNASSRCYRAFSVKWHKHIKKNKKNTGRLVGVVACISMKIKDSKLEEKETYQFMAVTQPPMPQSLRLCSLSEMSI